MAWFDILEEIETFRLYSNEIECSEEEGLSIIMLFLKNGQRCAIEIRTDEGTEILRECLIKQNDCC